MSFWDFFKKRKKKIDKSLLPQEDETANIVASMSKSHKLYKKLVLLAHPDRNPGKTEIAHEIMEQINIYRYNYRELSKLEQRVNNELKNENC